MAVYTVHEPPDLTGNVARDADRFRFVRDGFYGWAFLLAPLWLLWHRLWLVFLAYAVVAVALEGILIVLAVPTSGQLLAALAFMILVGTEGGTLRRFGLARRHFRLVGVVVGDDLETAERRFFATWDVARSAPRGRAQGAPKDLRAPQTRAGEIIGLFPEPGATR